MNEAASGRAYHVDIHHPSAADDDGPGDLQRPFRSISAAARLAGPGDAALVHPGVYRERVSPAHGGLEGRPVVYESVESRAAVIKASEVFEGPWRPEEGGVFAAELPDSLFTDLLCRRASRATTRSPSRPRACPAARR